VLLSARHAPDAAVATVMLVTVTLFACHSDDAPVKQLSHYAPSPHPVSTADLPPKYRDALASLERDDTAEEAKLALIQELAQELAGDDSGAATDLLLRSTSNPSILVSMASIKGLGARPCSVIVDPLEALVDDSEWQRRAWAAKILGDRHCPEALRKLTDRLQHERDTRVRDRLEAAIKALNEEVQR
jgi:HEAT repeat protein